MKNWKAVAAALAISLASYGAGAAFTPHANAAVVVAPQLRGERASARNLLFVRRRLEAMIDQLQRDDRDYGGHREAAIDDLQRARAEIEAAINWDATHPH